MDEAMGTGDIIIGIFAALGVVVLIVVFGVVVKTVLLKKDEETDEQP
jgi:hypothetical protein